MGPQTDDDLNESRPQAVSLFGLICGAGLGPVTTLAVGGATLIVAIAIGTFVAVMNFRDRALDTSKQQLENSVLLLSRHFENYLHNFTSIQRVLIKEFEPLTTLPPQDFARAMASPETHTLLDTKVGGLSDVVGINIWGPDGTLLNSSAEWPVRKVNITDREYFRAMKADPTMQQSVALLRNRLVGNWTIVIGCRISSPSGAFLGVMTRGVSPRSIEAFLDSIESNKDSSIAFLHADGTLMARIPRMDAMIGRKITIDNQPAVQPDHYTLQVVSPVDKVERVVAVRHIPSLPIIITASTTVQAALKEWRQQTRFLVGVGALGAVVIALTLSLIIRQLTREHQASRSKLRREKERFVTAVNNMTQGLLLFDGSGHLVMCNERYLDMFEGSRDVVKPGCSLRDLVRHRKAAGTFRGDVDEYCASFLKELELGAPGKIVIEADRRTIEMRYQPLSEGGWVTTAEDITERQRYEDKISHMAHYDSLTDLPNRALFRERLERNLAAMKANEQLAVLYIDVDEFKGINDSLGHPVGDELLKSIAARLCSCAGPQDFVARLGGDEFAVFRPGVGSRDDVLPLINKIHDAIRRPAECLGHHVVVDASIGVALASSGMRDLDQLVKNADLALYEAKSGGRRTWRFFESAMEERVNARRTGEIELRKAIRNGELEVHYQPIVDFKTEAVVGCEALIRWRHPQRGMISPAQFIPVAEDTGLINEIGEWVLRSACAMAATWPADTTIAVNVSPVQFREPGFALKVVGALGASGLAAHRLELEVTETVLINDDETTLAVLNELRALGVQISLDDFGTGYSSLSHLQRFPFDKIKIDRSFVRNVSWSQDSAAIVRAVVDIAGVRNIATTAEGVETVEQKDALRALGCAQMQGYLFSPAVPAAEIGALVSNAAKVVAA
jgi:diguanylate cyclase (GGDEF)-like protein